MRLAIDNRRLAATIVVIGLLAAAFVVACPLEARAMMTARSDHGCAVVQHSAGAGPFVEPDPARVPESRLGVPLPSLASSMALWMGIAAPWHRSRAPSWISADPLNGRLRL